MPINFDALPDDKPVNVPEKGTYFALIEKAEMKTGKTPGKPPYLNLTLALSKKDGTKVGKIFDIIAESESDLVRYKIKRFVTALEIPITGNFELKDLAKVVVNKRLICDVNVDEKSQPPRGQVDVFAGDIYYPLSAAGEIFGMTADDVPWKEDAPINAPDAADAGKPSNDRDEKY